MEQQKFIDFVNKNMKLARRGELPTRQTKHRFKVDPDNTRLASECTHDCEHCKRPVTNQVIYIQKMFTSYKQEPYWRQKCTNCKTVLNKNTK